MGKTLTAFISSIIAATALSQNVSVLPNQRMIGLAWTKSPDPTARGYNIYYGVSTRDYTNHIDVGNVDTTLVTNLSDNVNYYFSATAYDGTNESAFSNECNANMGPPPNASITNINGTLFYKIKQTRFTNDNLCTYMISTNGTSGWSKVFNASKLSETNIGNGSYVTTWLIPISGSTPPNTYFENEWLLERENTNRVPGKSELMLKIN